MSDPPSDRPLAIHWFRRDLRLTDNPALSAASAHGRVLPLYIDDEAVTGEWQLGAASRWWLHHSLAALNESLDGALVIARGDPVGIIEKLIATYQVDAVFWNRCYEPWHVERDIVLQQRLRHAGITVQSFNGSLLWEPWDVLKADGTPYRVFTPFFRKRCLTAPPPREPLAAATPELFDTGPQRRGSLPALKLLPHHPWSDKLESHWQIGENGAHERLGRFLNHGLRSYREGRDFPARESVSRLSPSLHFGELSPQQAWHAIRSEGDDTNIDHFCRELGWREFSYSLLYHFPDLPRRNLQARFDAFPWRDDATALQRWQHGTTGFPIVDAGMRELWQTGYMHNRVRMIAGSFLVKNLLIHWHAGERWFRDCLVDADIASNSAGWQWIAGCGADAAPYFRIFNPVIQGEKFDRDGRYVRSYCPELAALPDRYLHRPWTAPKDVLDTAGIRPGESYPLPLVDLKASRERALEAYRSMPKG